jgi:predicted nucleic acid-binding Zn ribbon protein
MKRYDELDELPENIVKTDKQHTCVICSSRVTTYDNDVNEYICSEECSEVLDKFRSATQSS